MSNSYDLAFWTKYAKNVHFVFKEGEIDSREIDNLIVGVNRFGEVGAYTFDKESQTDKKVINEIVNNGSIVRAIDAAYMAGINQKPFTLPDEKILPHEMARDLSKALHTAYERGRNFCPRSL